MRLATVLLALALTACVTREPSPQEIRSKRFETLPDKAVVYLYRDRIDFVDNPASFTLDGAHQGATYRGTYFRLELAPGRHQLAGFAQDQAGPIRRHLRDLCRRRGRARAGPVLHHKRLAENFRQSFCYRARDNIRATAGDVADNDPHAPGRIVLRGRNWRAQQHCKGQQTPGERF